MILDLGWWLAPASITLSSIIVLPFVDVGGPVALRILDRVAFLFGVNAVSWLGYLAVAG